MQRHVVGARVFSATQRRVLAASKAPTRRRHLAVQRTGFQYVASAADATGGGAPAPLSAAAWAASAPSLLQRLGLPRDAEPEAVWELLGALQRPHETQLQQETQQRGASPPPRPCPAEQLLRAQLDVPACQLLLAAASTSLGQLASAAPGEGIDRQARANRLRPLLRAAISHCSGFALADFRVLLRLAAAARFVPDPEWLATLLYADTGGIERFYKAAPPADVVLLLSDLAGVFACQHDLVADARAALLERQTRAGSPPPRGTAAAAAEAAAAAAADAELAALDAALDSAQANLEAVQADTLLAGELSALGGFWLLRRLLPALAEQRGGAVVAAADADEAAAADADEAVLAGLLALPGLGYQVLDREDAALLLDTLARELPRWGPTQLAAALSGCLPCLGPVAPDRGDALVTLFQAAGAAAPLLAPLEAAALLRALAGVPGYAPEPRVAQALLDAALEPPLQAVGARALHDLLAAADALGAAPRPQHLSALRALLSG